MSNDQNLKQPPAMAEWILKRIINDERESPAGDFEEYYNYLQTRRNRLFAVVWYFFQIIIIITGRLMNMIRLGIALINSYLKVTLRTLRKYREFSIINIIGFALSMSVCLMIIIFIKDQKNSDRFHENSSRIVRVYTADTELEWDVNGYATTPGALAPYLADTYPFIENTVRVSKLYDTARKGYNDIPVRGLYVEPSFFTIFDFDLKSGDPGTALDEPYSIIISEKTALRLFGEADPVNETILFNNIGSITITGVLKETDQRSHFQFDVLASFSTVQQLVTKGVFNANLEFSGLSPRFDYYTYVLLKKEGDISEFEEQLPRITGSIIPESDRDRYTFGLQHLHDINLGMILHDSMPGTKHFMDLVFLPFIGIVLIALSCSNYIILSIARALKRTKEIGLRKVIGAKRRDIISLFLCESFAIMLSALGAACILISWMIPAVNSIGEVQSSGLTINIEMMKDPSLYVYFFLFAAAVSIMAGIYPAVHLSLIKAINAMKGGTGKTGVKRFLTRKILMGVQFAISLMSIIFIVYFYQVVEYWMSFDTGIDTENMACLSIQDVNHEIILNELLADSRITGVSFSQNIPIFGGRNHMDISGERSENSVRAFCTSIDPEFITNFGLQIIAGRNFSGEFYTDIERAVIVNEKTTGLLNLGNAGEAIGKRIFLDGENEKIVIGVVKDFNFRSLENSIGPMVFLNDPVRYRYANIRYVQGRKEDLKSSLTELWKKLDEYHPVDYMFFEDIQEDISNATSEALNLSALACGYIIFVALCGLLGMSMYTTELRVKEISIRKVFGSSVFGAVYILSRDYIKLILYASAFAIPVAVGLTAIVMQFIAHRPGLSLWVPPVTLVFVLSLALLTISSQTIKTANTNPVEILREE